MVSATPHPRWFVVSTQPNREPVAVENLRRQGLATFCPLRTVTIRHARRVSQRNVAAFAGYVFVQLDPGEFRWRSVNGTRGVRSIIADDAGPVPLQDGVVEALRMRTGPDGVLKSREDLSVGDTVRFAAGPFAERLATIDDLDDTGRIVLLFDLFGRQIRAAVRDQHVLWVGSGRDAAALAKPREGL